MDIHNIEPDDIENAGKLINTAAKSFLGKKFIGSLENYFNRKSKRKDDQAHISEENAKVIESAEAEVKADLIKFNAELEKGGILAEYIKRSGNHLISERIRKDFNIDSVIGMAVDQLDNENTNENSSESSRNEKLPEEDWFSRWASVVENISEENVQKIWASILAGEVKAPGSFSLRSLDIIRNLSKQEGEAFTRLCNFVIVASDNFKFVLKKNGEMLPQVEDVVGLQGVRILEEAGLISSGSVTIFGGIELRLFPHQKANIPTQYSYGNLHINVIPKIDMAQDYDASIITLTQTGQELHSIVNVIPSMEYMQLFKDAHLSKTRDFSMSIHDIISRDKLQYRYNPRGIILH